MTLNLDFVVRRVL